MLWTFLALPLISVTKIEAFHVRNRQPPLSPRPLVDAHSRHAAFATTKSLIHHQTQLCMSSNDDDGVSWIQQNKFNPFDYQTSSGSRSTSSSSSTQPISFRKMQMQQVFSELLDAAGSRMTMATATMVDEENEGSEEEEEDVLQSILDDNKDVVLNPLEQDQAFLDTDSVIRPGMTRPERYQIYLESLDTRIEAAKNRQVKAVLEAIRYFVQRHE